MWRGRGRFRSELLFDVPMHVKCFNDNFLTNSTGYVMFYSLFFPFLSFPFFLLLLFFSFPVLDLASGTNF
jgi:hypothetical protein